MTCLQCQSVKPIPTCTTDLALGTTELGNGIAVYIFVKNLTTGKEYRQAATTEALPAGRVTLDMTSPSAAFYSPNHSYEIWITRQSDTINERQDFTVQGSALELDCANVVFEKFADDSAIVAYSSHILEIDT